jgi:hypothetical protein
MDKGRDKYLLASIFRLSGVRGYTQQGELTRILLIYSK